MLELFVQHRELKPAQYAELSGFRPVVGAWSYLLHYHRRGLLRRHRDWRGRVVYSIGRNGAAYLLWWKRKFPNAKVPL